MPPCPSDQMCSPASGWRPSRPTNISGSVILPSQRKTVYPPSKPPPFLAQVSSTITSGPVSLPPVPPPPKTENQSQHQLQSPTQPTSPKRTQINTNRQSSHSPRSQEEGSKNTSNTPQRPAHPAPTLTDRQRRAAISRPPPATQGQTGGRSQAPTLKAAVAPATNLNPPISHVSSATIIVSTPTPAPLSSTIQKEPKDEAQGNSILFLFLLLLLFAFHETQHLLVWVPTVL